MADRTLVDHAAHDLELIAAVAVGGADRETLARAAALVAACRECAELRADLRALAAATRASASLTRPAPRDFRLTPETARRLRGGSVRTRLVRALSGAGGLLRPTGVALATMGLVGIIATGGLGGLAGDGTAGGGDHRAQVAGSPDTKDLASPEGAFGPAASSADPNIQPVIGPATSGAPAPTGSETSRDRGQPSTLAPIALVASAAALLAGLGLLLASFSRRPRAG